MPTEHQDYVFAPKVHVNEGITTGMVTKAALLGTHRYIFVLPLESVQVLGFVATHTQNQATLVNSVAAALHDKSIPIQQVEQGLLGVLDNRPQQRVFPVELLDVLKIQVGFWKFGGLRLRTRGDGLKVVDLQPKAAREAWATFFGPVLRG